MRFREEIEVATPLPEAFAYVADFSHAAEWDPGIAESRLLTDDPLRAGSEFAVVAVFRGRRQQFRYTVTTYEENRRVVLEGEGAKARSTDEVVFAAAGAGTRITYEADLRLKGLARVAEPFLQGAIEKMGRDALAGLKAALDTR